MKRKYFVTFTMILSCLLSRIAFAQNPEIQFDHLSIENGLSQSAVSNIFQDSWGFIWVGTQDGLNKYDGYKFTVYKSDPVDSISISDNYIWVIREDRSRNLWIGTHNGGLNRWDRDKDQFVSYKNVPSDSSSLLHNSVRTICIDKNDRMWIGTRSGLNRFVPEKNNFRRYVSAPGHAHSLVNNYIRILIEDHAGYLWVGTNKGLDRFDPVSERFDHFPLRTADRKAAEEPVIWSLCEDDLNTLWIGTKSDGLFALNPATGAVRQYRSEKNNPYALSNNGIWTIFEDRERQLWFGTEGGGLNLFDRNADRFYSFQNSAENKRSISHDLVQSVCEDRSGILWVGTLGGGLNLYDRNKYKFRHYKNNPLNPNSLSSNFVWPIIEDHEGNIWIGTEGGGLNKFTVGTHAYTHFRHKPSDNNSPSDDIIRSLYEDKEHIVWIGTESGLDRYDPVKGRFTHYMNDPKNPNSLSHNTVWSIAEDSSGYLWIGTQGGGLNRFDRKSSVFIRYEKDARHPNSLSHNIIRSVYVDRKNNVWIGTDGGLDRYNSAINGFDHFRNEPGNPNSLSHNMILSITETADGNIWIGTVGGGVNRLDPGGKQFIHYTEKNGLSNDVVYGILEDGSHNLWMSTNKGITKFIFGENGQIRFRLFDVNDGLQSNEFNQAAFCKTKSGQFLFGGIGGFNYFSPDKVKDNPFVPPVVLTAFYKFNKPVRLEKCITGLDALELSYKDYVFSIDFSALSYTLSGKNRYAYKMEGFDEDWIQAGTRPFVTYTNLDPGEYVFKVKGSNCDGVWNEEGTTLKIVITPPFWKTWWFRILAFLSVVVSAWVWYANRIRRMEKQKKVLEQLVAERTTELNRKKDELEALNVELKKLNELKNEFLGIAAHDLRSPLGAMIGFIDLLVQDIRDGQFDPALAVDDLESVLKSGRQMAHLISELLDISAIESGKINLDLQRSNLNQIFEECENLHRRRASQKDIRLIVEKNSDIPEILIDKARIAEVVDNLLGNAIKYTFPGGEVHLYCEIDVSNVVTNIKDNGQGLSEEDIKALFEGFKRLSAKPTGGETSTGLGLAIVKKIVSMHNGKVWVKSRKGEGSTFSFSLPIK